MGGVKGKEKKGGWERMKRQEEEEKGESEGKVVGEQGIECEGRGKRMKGERGKESKKEKKKKRGGKRHRSEGRGGLKGG